MSVPAKSGTTWMMNIVHQLRTGGDPGFKDIYIEVPWLEFVEGPSLASITPTGAVLTHSGRRFLLVQE